jgi:co-chaperonin GroES (HSP10)
MAKLVPIKDKIAVVRIKSKLETDSGIVIESSRSDGVDKAKVIAIGPNVDLVQVDQTVLIDWSKVVHATIENNPVYVLSQDDVNAILEE